MGIYDRDYMADSRRGSGSWSIVTWLLVINSVAYLIQHLFFNNSIIGSVNLSKDTLFAGQIWRLLSFQFCHSNIGHFLGNMLFLFFLGRMFEQLIGSKWILPIYLIGGLFGGLAHVVWQMLFDGPGVIGASASVLAIVAALVVSIPEQPISLLFIPFQFKVKYFGWAILGFNVIGLLLSVGSSSGISHISHLGGMAAGWLFVKSILPTLKDRANRDSGTGKKRSKIAEAAEEQIKKKRQKETVYLNKKVDVILEKISREGMQSLTPEERNILERSSKKLSRKLDDK